MKIAILDDYQHVIETLSCYNLLKGQEVVILHKNEKDIDKQASLIGDSEVLVLTRERTAIGEALLSRLPKLKLISQTGKISNHLDLNACTKHGVLVAEGVGSPVAPAELSWALLMNTVRKIPQAMEGMKQGEWQVNIGSTVFGKTIGIWGYGKIGKRMAGYAKAFGANVLVWGSEGSRRKAVDDGFEQAETKALFFEKSDIITLHLRLTEQTHGIVKEADLFKMKKNAALINTARAELIEKDALRHLLDKRKDILAGLDVYETEPIYDPNFYLLQNDNVVCTPHLGYVERNSYELYFGKAFENVISYINGSPLNIANPAALSSLHQ
jgi:D-3-phosphoglycerate dehydrogenase